MLDETIADSEELFRAIVDHPDFWKAKLGRPTSAVFKDSRGLSVDRGGGRPSDSIVGDFRRRMPERGLVLVTALQCRNVSAFVKSNPLDSNPFHALILDGPESGEIELKSRKAKQLAKNATVLYAPEHVRSARG